MRMPALMQAFGDHAVYVATRSQSGISDDAHQPPCRSAIDDCYSRLSPFPTERSLSGKSSARGHGDKDRTVVQSANLAVSGHVERPTSPNDVIDPRLQCRGHGEVMHGSSNDHKV